MELFGKTVELVAPLLTDAMAIQLEAGRAAALKDDSRVQKFLDVIVKAVVLTLRVNGESVDELIAGKIVMETGLQKSPITISAMRLCGCPLDFKSDDTEDDAETSVDEYEVKTREDMETYPF